MKPWGWRWSFKRTPQVWRVRPSASGRLQREQEDPGPVVATDGRVMAFGWWRVVTMVLLFSAGVGLGSAVRVVTRHGQWAWGVGYLVGSLLLARAAFWRDRAALYAPWLLLMATALVWGCFPGWLHDDIGKMTFGMVTFVMLIGFLLFGSPRETTRLRRFGLRMRPRRRSRPEAE